MQNMMSERWASHRHDDNPVVKVGTLLVLRLISWTSLLKFLFCALLSDVCVCLCLCTCVCVYLCLCLCVCMSACMCESMYVCVCLYVCMCVCMSVCVSVCLGLWLCICMYLCDCMCGWHSLLVDIRERHVKKVPSFYQVSNSVVQSWQ